MTQITEYTCHWCGMNNPYKAKYYDGAIGYEAVICTVCGAYTDDKDHAPDNWSMLYIGYNEPFN